eukprot:5908745-Pleurochrysis_carterae.AAC.1
MVSRTLGTLIKLSAHLGFTSLYHACFCFILYCASRSSARWRDRAAPGGARPSPCRSPLCPAAGERSSLCARLDSTGGTSILSYTTVLRYPLRFLSVHALCLTLQTSRPIPFPKPSWDASQVTLRSWQKDIQPWLLTCSPLYTPLIENGYVITSQGCVVAASTEHAES